MSEVEQIEEVVEVEEVKPKKRVVKSKINVICDEHEYLKSIKFDMEWLQKLGTQYGFDEFQYLHKFRAFRCFKSNQHLDWIDVNDAALLNGARRLDKILLKHQPLSPKRAVINYPWR